MANANADSDEIEGMESSEFCDERRLYYELRKSIFLSLMRRWGLMGYDLDLRLRTLLSEYSYSLSLNDSVYRDIDYLDGFSLKIKELSDVVNARGHLIGLDKIGHFFAEGWTYFEMTRYDNETLEKAMDWGSQQEAGKFGYTTTGIYSFADLVANFNGWRFWNEIALTADDPLRSFLGNVFRRPYVRCEYQLLPSIKHGRVVKNWKLVKRFDLADYIDGAWDEGNNCNSHADPIIEDKVKRRIQDVAPDFKCPVNPADCVEARQQYGKFAKQLLHPSCLTAGGH